LLAERAREVVGVDYSPAAIAHARETYPLENLRFEIADANALDPGLGGFDLITCFEVIEHIQDEDVLLSQLAAALRPTGMLLLSTPNAQVDRLFEELSHHGQHAYHVNLLRPDQLRRRLRCHFRSVTLYGQSYRGSLLYVALKALDVFNVRHRLVRSQQLQRTVSRTVGRARAAPTARSRLSPGDFQFNRWLVRQSPITVAAAWREARD
jgi:SAM-dependent methyltransferase